jgi:hypothetical protein
MRLLLRACETRFHFGYQQLHERVPHVFKGSEWDHGGLRLTMRRQHNASLCGHLQGSAHLSTGIRDRHELLRLA